MKDEIKIKTIDDQTIAEVSFIDFMMAIPDDHPYADTPVEDVKQYYETWLKNNYNVSKVEWI